MKTTSRMPVKTPDTVSKALCELHGSSMPWRKIASLEAWKPIPAGTLSSIAKGDPIPRKWRNRLGLPSLIPTPACVKCGNVHVSKRCTQTRRAARLRASISLTNAESAADTIRRKMDAETVAALVELLKQ